MRDATGGRHVALATLAGLVLLLQATCASASREGGAMVEPILWMVAIVLVGFVTLVIGGGVLGAFRASRSGDSVLKGGARGLVKGLITFVIASAWVAAGLTALGFLWIAYAFFYVHVLNPS